MNTKEIKEIKSEFTNEQHRFYYQKNCALRDKYLIDNAEYLNTKCKVIGLNDSATLGELCFVLSKKDDLDDRGDRWIHTYLIGTLHSEIFDIKKKRKSKVRCLEVLGDVMQTPMLMERLNINPDDTVALYREMLEEIKDNEWYQAMDFKPKKKTEGFLINRCADDLFIEMQNQINPDIKAKRQILFVMDIFREFKFFDYHMGANEYKDGGLTILDNDPPPYGSNYKRIETQRTRAL